MNTDNRFVVSIPLVELPDVSGTLKRLALFCDEIRLFLPDLAFVREDIFNDNSRVEVDSDGRRNLRDFNYFEDVDHFKMSLKTALKRLSCEDRETLQGLIDRGVVHEVPAEGKLPSEEMARLKDLRGLLVSHDARDAEFNHLTGTKPDDYLISDFKAKITVKTLDEAHELKLLQFDTPAAIAESFDITSSLVISEACGYYPVFPTQVQRKILFYRFEQYQKGLAILSDRAGLSPEGLEPRWKFGQLMYTLGNAVFTSDVVDTKSVDDVLRFRTELADARVRFLSENVYELSQMIEGEPWSEKRSHQVRTFVTTKLQPELHQYEIESKEAWEKMFGALTVNLAGLVKSTTIGGASAGLLGSVIPGTTTVAMLALGALAGAAKETPAIVKNLVDFALSVRKQRRNSIAYLAEFK